MDNEAIKEVEREIGYTFRCKKLLEQAFTRKSYTDEQRQGCNNEILEFFGDKVLDFMVIREMADEYGSLYEDMGFWCARNEGDLSEAKKQIVNSKSLAERIDDLGFARYLVMSKGDTNSNAQEQTHVKEDLFEAILGAVAIDCEWDLKKLRVSVDMMLHLDDILQQDLKVPYDPVSLVQRWNLRKYGTLPEYKFISQKDKPNRDRKPLYDNGKIYTYAYAYEDEDYKCILSLAGKEFIGYGFTKSEARYQAAVDGYEYLEQEGLVFLLEDEIGEVSEETAVANLQILSQKGYFDTPQYSYTEDHDDDGNPVWKCVCSIAGFEYSTWYKASTKKEAKRMAAYHMLDAILGNQMGTIGKLEG